MSEETTQVEPDTEINEVVEGQQEVTEPTASPEEQQMQAEVDAADAQEAAAAEAEEYTPNFKFSVKDKELEIDEWARPLVTSKDNEDKLRDLFERAHGIDEVKADRKTLRTELKDARDQYAQVQQNLNHLGTYVQNKDFRSFFEALAIPKQDIIQYAINELKYQEMSPEQRQEIDSQRAMQTQMSQLQMQNQMLTQQSQQAIQTQAETSLSNALAQPDVASVASAYDARVGQPGAFRQEVINRGAYYEQVQGVTKTGEELAKELVSMLGGAPQTTTQTPTPTQVGSPSTEQGQAQVITKQDKVVIPNVSSKAGTSPVRNQVKSIADLNKRREQLMAQQP